MKPKVVSVLFIALALVAPAVFAANGSVTAASGGTNLSADLAANGSTPTYTTLGTISINEGNGGNRGDIAASQSNVTVILSAPAGWEFQAGQGSVSAPSGSITSTSINVTASAITVTFSTDSATNVQDTLSISGIKVRAQNALITSSPAGTITRTGGTATFSNFDGSNLTTVNFGSLSETAAAANKLVIGTNVPATGTAGVAFSPSPTVQIQDTYGNPRSSDTTTITATRNTGSGTAAMQGTTSVAAVAGVATFSNLKYNIAGETVSVDFGAAGLAGATSSAITISAGPTATFSFSTPASTTAGNSFSFTVQAKDAVGNDTPAYAGTVHFTSSDGQAVLPGDTTLTAGAGTFNATLKTAGSRTITATDTVSGSITGTSSSISVSAAAVSALVVSLPASVTAGTAFSGTVTAKDAYNNTVTSYAGTIHFTTSAASSALPSNYTFTGGDAGVHTFTNGFTINSSGSQSITATDTVAGSVTGSSNITINAGNAAALAFFVQPGSATAGSAFAQQPVIKTVDAFGNVTTTNIGNSKTVTIILQSGTGTLQGSASINIGDNGPTPGTATFTNLQIDTAGAKILRASNNTYGTVDSASFTVSAGNATHLAFTTQPGNATAGSVFGTQPVVQARDAFGNDTSAGLGGSKIVTISLLSGTGTLQGTNTIDIAGSGVAAFAGLRIDAAGGKTLRATAPGLTQADSTSFTVSPGPPALVTKTGGDAQTLAAGSTHSASVNVQDAFGNNVPSTNVLFTITGGNGLANGGATANVSTDGSGNASVNWTFGPVAGANTMTAAAGTGSATFTGTATCTYTTKASGNWNAPATWVGECVPGASDNVTISSGHNVTVTANAAAASLTFAAASTDSSVSLNNGVSLTVGGLLRINPPTPAGVTSTMAVGNGTLNIAGLELNGAGNRTAVLSIVNGTVNLNGSASFPGNPPTQKIDISGSGVFNITGDFATGATIDHSNTASFHFIGTNQTVGAYNPPNGFPHTEIASNVTMLGNLKIDGTLTINAGKSFNTGTNTLQLAGDLSVNGGFTTNGTVIVNGSAAQTFGGTTSPLDFANLTMNNAAGLGINVPITVAGTLTLTNGNISTGSNSVTILGGGSVSRTSGHVIGYLAKVLNALGSRTFEVGTANGYSPVSVNATTGSFPTTFTATAIQGPHPSSPSANALQRYWTLNPGAVTAGDLTFNYLAGDVVGNELLYFLGRYNSGWTYPAASVDAINHVASASGVTGLGGDFTLHSAATALRVASVNGGVNPTAGTAFSVTVESVDPGNNLTPVSSNTTITLTLNSGTGPLGGTLTGQILANTSSVVISGVTYTKAESGVVLTASTTAGMSLSPANSASFTVDPGPTSKLNVAAPASATAGTPITLTVTALDAYDNVTPAFTGTVHFTSTDGQGVLPVDYAFTGGDAGVHTYSLETTLKTAGTQTVTATSGVISGSANVVVNPSFTDHLIVAAPANVTAGAPFNITVTAADSYNNTTPAFSGTIHFTSSDPNATLPADFTFTNADNGVKTFTGLVLKTAGSRTVTATLAGPPPPPSQIVSDIVAVAITGTATINVDPAALDHFLVEAAGGGSIAPQTAGAAFNIGITAKDAFNNTVTSFNSSVQITSNGTLTGAPLTSGAFTGGVLASQPLTITSAQASTTVSATHTASGRNGTSNSFAVNPAGTANFLIEAGGGGNIAPQIAGTPFAIRITARDAFGNTNTAFTGTLDLTSNAGAVNPLTVTFAGADNGVKTINVTLTVANAAATLTATHASSGNSGTSNPFAVSGANANAFLVEAGTGGNIAPQVAGAAFSIRVTARDTFGNTSTGYSGTVTLSTNAGTVAPPSITFTGADAGVKTVSVTLSTSGTGRTITASDSSGSGASNPFTVNAGPLDHFRVEAAAGGNIGAQTAGTPFAIRISALDANDNVVPSFNGAGNTVNITSTGTLLSGGGTTATFANGVLASHTVNISDGGTFTITATKTGGAQSGTSNSFAVSGGADLSVSIGGTNLVPGSPGTVAIVVTNAGPSAATSVSLAFTAPGGWTVAPASPCSSFPCSLGTINANSSVTVLVSLTAPIGSQGTVYTVAASVSSAIHDPVAANNSTSAQVGVQMVRCPTGISEMKPDSTGGTSGDLTWRASDADTYEVYFGPAGTGCTTLAGLVTDTRFAYRGLESGKTYEWRVVTNKNGCSPVASACVKFTANCPTVRISGIAETASKSSYRVRWSSIDGVKQYDVQESTSSDFANATTQTTAAQVMPFRHTVTAPTAFFYRVRINGSCTNGWSPTLRVVVQPPQSPADTAFDVVVERGATDPLTQDIHFNAPEGLNALAAGFTAGADVPWLTVSPAAGTVPPGGQTFTVTVAPSSLPAGSSTGTVVVRSAAGATLAAWPLSVHAMEPVEEGGKSATSADTTVIAGVAHAEGVGSTWRSDVRVYNPSAKAAEYDIWFTPSRTDGTKEGRHTTIEVAAGATLALDDVVRRTFGYGSMAGENATGALDIRPHDAAQIALATSRTYNVTPDGTYGQYMPATNSSRFATNGTTLSLQQVAQSSAYRTNLGVVEGSGSGATLMIRIYDASGAKLAEMPVTLAAYEQQQIDGVLAKNGVTASDARIEVDVTSKSGSVAAYASVVDNATNDSLLVPGIVPAKISASRYVVPGIADFTTSRNTWRSDLRIYNAGAASVQANVFFYSDGGALELMRQVTIAPREVKSYDSVLRTLFDVRDTGGSVHVATSGQTSLVVTARTYDQRNGGTYGQFIPAMLPGDATSLGGRPLEILHVDQSARYRANVGVAETSGNAATVQLTATVADGRTAQTTIELKANEFRQIGSLLATLGLDSASNARVTVRVTGGSGRVVAYASTIDNKTQDPTYIPGM